MVYKTVTKGKTFHVSYRLPADQVPQGKSVYLDILDTSGNYVGAPIEMSRLGNSDIVEAEVTAPSTTGKYILMVWIGTWDGSTRTIDEIVDYETLLVVDKDIEDRVTTLENDVAAIKSDIELLKKLVKRHWA